MNSTRSCLGIIAMACLLVGFYCCELNHQLYQHKCPFHDSLDYQQQLFRVMTLSREQGLSVALHESCFSNSTVCLPYIVASIVAPFVSPDRLVGVWIQTGWLLLFLLSLFYYFNSIKALPPKIATLGCLVFLTALCLYFDHGGLSDFRMDLGLCLTFGIAVCWFLSAMARPAWWRFGMLGLTAGLCCLARGTAPVYLVFTFAPIVAWDFLNAWLSRKSKSKSDSKTPTIATASPPMIGTKIRGLTFSASIVALVAGWFYVGNFAYLYHYYVVWNTDANAKVPWIDALEHLIHMYNCLGLPITAVWMAWSIGALAVAVRAHGLKAQTALVIRERDFDLRILWIGLAPTILIIARRSGMNPFVCMPSIIGLTLFLMLPILKQLKRSESRALIRYCWIVLLIGFAMSGYRGWRRHQPRTGFNTMKAQAQILDHIISDSQTRTPTRVRFGTMQLTELHTSSLYAILQYDRDNVQRHLNWVEIEGTRFDHVHVFSKPATADWADVRGDSDQAKMESLIGKANRELDYLVVPDEETAKHLQATFGQIYINRFLPELRTKLLAGPWEKVSEAYQVQRQEYVEIYRRVDE
jgi:hypothetical protein